MDMLQKKVGCIDFCLCVSGEHQGTVSNGPWQRLFLLISQTSRLGLSHCFLESTTNVVWGILPCRLYKHIIKDGSTATTSSLTMLLLMFLQIPKIICRDCCPFHIHLFFHSSFLPSSQYSENTNNLALCQCYYKAPFQFHFSTYGSSQQICSPWAWSTFEEEIG